jgi:uncharacterized membrane protein YwaF
MKIREMHIGKKLILVGGLLTIIWGIAHLFPTNSVVRGFGNISFDNANIIIMEWIIEGFVLIFIGLLIIVVTIKTDSHNKVTKAVYLLTFAMLVAMSVLSLFTGFKVDFLPFKLCPAIFMTSGLLVIQGYFDKNS